MSAISSGIIGFASDGLIFKQYFYYLEQGQACVE